MGTIRTKAVRIRKPRKCFGCLDLLKKGSVGHTQTITDNGQIYDVTVCPACYAYIQGHIGYDDCFCEGELKEFKGV